MELYHREFGSSPDAQASLTLLADVSNDIRAMEDSWVRLVTARQQQALVEEQRHASAGCAKARACYTCVVCVCMRVFVCMHTCIHPVRPTPVPPLQSV